jgi:hypothetical protein
MASAGHAVILLNAPPTPAALPAPPPASAPPAPTVFLPHKREEKLSEATLSSSRPAILTNKQNIPQFESSDLPISTVSPIFIALTVSTNLVSTMPVFDSPPATPSPPILPLPAPLRPVASNIVLVPDMKGWGQPACPEVKRRHKKKCCKLYIHMSSVYAISCTYDVYLY